MKFIADQTLGRLARLLRMLGYDTLYYRGALPYEILRLARRESRVVLTRNTRLLARSPEDRVIRIAEDDPWLQLKGLIEAGPLAPEAGLFSRCTLCNQLLEEVPTAEARGNVPDFILYHEKRFHRCPGCRRIYWRGSHHANMQKRIEKLLGVPSHHDAS